MNKKVREVLETIVDRFRSGDIPQAVAIASFPIPEIPCSRWSLMNRTLMFLSGTADARGYQQWRQANRWVRKGAKAVYILVPYIKRFEDKDDGEEQQRLAGFMCRPVFRLEDTDGEALDYEQLELPELPLLERAEGWGISVRAVPGNYRYQGYYSPDRHEIALASPDESVFFHELSHASHEKIKGSLKTGQDALQEIVAELSAQALCAMVGKRSEDTVGNSYRYIESYAEKLGLSPHLACLRVMSDTEKVLGLILGNRQEGHPHATCADRENSVSAAVMRAPGS